MQPPAMPARSRLHMLEDTINSGRTNARSFLEALDVTKRRRLSMALTRPGGDRHCSLDVDSLPELSVFEHQELKALFDMLDDDGSGAIDEDEMRRAFDMMGEKNKQEKVSEIMEIMAQDGQIYFEDFKVVLHLLMRANALAADLSHTVGYMNLDPPKTLVDSKLDEIKGKVRQFIDEPNSSRAAMAATTIIITTIVVSTASFVVETMPRFHRTHNRIFDNTETFAVAVFTCEFLLRMFSTPKLSVFFVQFLNIVDIAAILPYFLELVLGQTNLSLPVIRVVRLVRIFRLFKISRYVTWLKVFFQTIASSAVPLFMTFVAMAVMVIVLSSLMYNLERGNYDAARNLYVDDQGKATNFQSIFAAMWWCLPTLITIGYGDVVPVTPWGKLLAGVTAFFGVILLAIPISIIENSFKVEHERAVKNASIQSNFDKAAAPKDMQESTEQLTALYLDTFLRTTRGNRQRLIASMKQAELESRNTVTADLCRLVDDMREIDPSWEERGEVDMEEEEWVADKGTTPLREGEGPQEGVVSDQGTAATVGY